MAVRPTWSKLGFADRSRLSGASIVHALMMVAMGLALGKVGIDSISALRRRGHFLLKRPVPATAREPSGSMCIRSDTSAVDLKPGRTRRRRTDRPEPRATEPVVSSSANFLIDTSRSGRFRVSRAIQEPATSGAR